MSHLMLTFVVLEQRSSTKCYIAVKWYYNKCNLCLKILNENNLKDN